MNIVPQHRLMIIGALLVIVSGLIFAINQQVLSAATADSYTYLPLVMSPDEVKNYPVPQVTNTITLPGALCPNDIAYNAKTDNWYILNTGSSDVSIVANEQWQYNAWVGGRPTAVDVNQSTGLAYVTNLPEAPPPARPEAGLRPCGDPFGDGRDPACISVFNGPNLDKQLDVIYEPFAVRVNPVTGIAYATDLDSRTYLLENNNIAASLRTETPEYGNSGWVLSLAHDTITNRTYLPSWEKGIVYIIEGANFVDSFSYGGWGATDIEVDQNNGYIYIANSQTNIPERPTNNISILKRDSHEVKQISTALHSQSVAVNQTTGYAYVTNLNSNSVTILKDGAVVNTVSLPGQAWDVEVNQETGYAFVILKDEESVVVFKDATAVAQLDAGEDPFAVGVDNVNGITYVINRTAAIAHDDLGRPYELCLDNPTITVLK